MCALQVFIYSTADKEKDQFCGGSILNNSFVVTAANCYLGADWTHYVFAGEFNLTLQIDSIKSNTFEHEIGKSIFLVEKFIVHNGWNESSLTHDIALIKVSCNYRYLKT